MIDIDYYQMVCLSTHQGVIGYELYRAMNTMVCKELIAAFTHLTHLIRG